MDSMKKVGDKRTILTDANGQPVCVTLAMREASSAPTGTRIKATLAIAVDDSGHPQTIDADADEQVKGVALPFAHAVACGCEDKAPHGYTPEFRLEMN
jgi:hypothetical protein